MSDAEAREAMEFDVLVVGGGPAGLAAAIRLKQVAPDVSVCLVEKGSEIGAHTLSGAVLEPRALDELLPDWRDDPPALATPAGADHFMYLTERRAFRLPTPPGMANHGNYVVSLGNVCRWLGAKAEALGVEIYPGFAASDLVVEDGQVKGVVAGVMGIEKTGTKGPNYQPGMELRATYTLFAEGCRGSLTKKLFERYKLREGVAPQRVEAVADRAGVERDHRDDLGGVRRVQRPSKPEMLRYALRKTSWVTSSASSPVGTIRRTNPKTRAW